MKLLKYTSSYGKGPFAVNPQDISAVSAGKEAGTADIYFRRWILTVAAEPSAVIRDWENAMTEAPESLTRTEDLLRRLYVMSRFCQFDAATTEIFAYTDELLSAGKFSECDQLLAFAHPELLDPTLLAVLLAATLAAKAHLPSRAEFFSRVQEKLIRMEPQRVVGLLAGLS